MSDEEVDVSGDLPALAGDEEEGAGEYYFESDPLALKNSLDYQLLMKTLVRLFAQRSKAVKDMERLQEVREQALHDPLSFVTALQNGENLNLPDAQHIAQIPHIDWEKYDVKSLTQGMRPKTRKRILQDASVAEQNTDQVQECKDLSGGKIFVRGRLYDSSKPQTFNQSWTDEEQRKLEELLIKYPDEFVASRRYVKISKELGTRTPLQVQSRVQKYFQALKREKLPIPGRMPRRQIPRRRMTSHRSMLANKQSSKFMTAFQLYEEEDRKPATMEHTDGSLADLNCYLSDEEDIMEELHHTEEYRELMRMKQVRSLKSRELCTGIVAHTGFTCDACGQDPIMGTRWHCMECPTITSVDLCDSCVKTDYSSDTHLAMHKLQPVRALSIQDSITALT